MIFQVYNNVIIGIEQNLKIKNCNLRTFSVIIDEKAKIAVYPSAIRSESIVKFNSNINDTIDPPNNKNIYLLTDKTKNKKCCHCCLIL